MVEKIFRQVDFILAACIALFLPGRLSAQTEAEDYMVVNRLTREDGLPDQDINGIYFDNQGYAWIGTFGGGLVRYDGDSVLPFSSKTGASTIGDIVRQCREDDYGRLWIPGASLEVMDMKTLTPLGDLPGMSKAWRRAHAPQAMRSDDKGGIWFTARDQLFRIGFADNGKRILVDSLQCDVANDNLMPKAGDVEQDGSVWITLGGHFYKVRPIESKGLTKSEILPDLFIGENNRATAFQRSGNEVWIGTMNGLYRVDLNSGEKTCFQHSDADPHSLPNNEITGLCLTEDNEIVIGTLGGVSIYNPARHSFDTYGSRANDYGNQILPGEIVRSIATRGRQIWVGLEAEGLVILQKKSLKLTNISRIETTSSPIPTTPIRALFIDSHDDLWLAATGFGVCRQVGDLKFRNYNPENSALAGNTITAFCEDGQGRLWMGTVDGHLNYISLNSPDVVRVPEGSQSEIARNINVILGMVYDPVNEYIWLVARNALCYYDLRRSAFAEFSPRIPGCLGACRMDDKLWVSSIEGLRVIDLKSLEFRTIAGFPMSMALVRDGDSIWAGTYGSGLYRLDNCQAEEPEITVYSEENGLCDDQINGLLLDGMYLWITTENGLSRLDTQTGELTNYGRNDGLKSMSFCENSVAKGREGTIYIGQKEGGFSILRSSYVSNELGNQPAVVISGYYSKDEFHNLASSDTIVKGEQDNDFTLKFADLSYGTRTDIVYESRISPLEKTWAPIFGHDTHVKFGHIPGGKYKIQIRAVDKKGNVLSQAEKALVVIPVVYNRWWFRLLAFLLLGSLVYLFVRWYTRSINKKKDLLQQEVDRQTKELKQQKEELERKAEALAEQNALLQKQNEMIASHNTLLSSTSAARDSDFSAQLLEAIQKLYKDPELDVYKLADALGMNRNTLNEKIQEGFGLSIAQFIRTYRLNVAKEMLSNGTNTDMTVSEIAYEVGFNDPKYFTRCFAKEFGATPSEMQKKG